MDSLVNGMSKLSTSSILDGIDVNNGAAGDNAESRKKLAILGLPWETSEETLRAYFEEYGDIEHAEVMRDRYTGKSRGFGFVTYADESSAQRALQTEHVIDGRRCEAKVALPKGEQCPPRTTRIFVARIAPTVTETQFKSYFESFGKLQDAYMPRDHSKQGYRGIGFVTYASPDSVEKVMASKHQLNGQEVAIDRATPKEEPSALKSMLARLPLTVGQRRSFDNGAGIIGPGLTSVLGNGVGPSNLRPKDMGSQPPSSSGTVGLPANPNAAAAAAAATTAALQSLAKGNSHGEQSSLGLPSQQMGSMPLAAASSVHGLPHDVNASLISNALSKAGVSGIGNSSGLLPDLSQMGAAAAIQQLMAAAAAQSSRRSLDSATAALKCLENPAIASARAGPRIFVGKLTKETSEADVKDYFMRFGYVMDVYLPKSKDNKQEHRGFGFVTFETEAAIQRVVSHGAHRLKGSTIAIDIAMPKVEEEAMALEGMDSSAPDFLTPALTSLMQQRM